DAQIRATQILIIGGRFDDAKARATAWLAKNPRDVDAIILRANALAAMNEPTAAIAEIEEALKIQPGDSATFANVGTIRMRTGDAGEDEAAFRKAIDLDSSSVNAHLALANFLWAAGRRSEAEQETGRALSVQPRHLLANRMLGVLYIATGRPKEA